MHGFEAEARSASCAAPPDAAILHHVALWPRGLRARAVPPLCVALPAHYPAEATSFGVDGARGRLESPRRTRA